jgi:hypothetical protein
MQYRIIRVFSTKVSIAASDGTFFDVPIEELNFEPKVGDEVQCFKNGEKVIVHRESNDNLQPTISHKIIRVLNGIVSIASSDGSLFNVPIEEVDFEPKVGDEVQCFKKGKNFIVLKGVPRQSFSVHNESRLQTQKESQNFVPTKNVFGEEKKSNGVFFVSLIILGIVAIVVVGVYFYTKNNPTDLAREYCESVSCYVENHSSACRHEANYIRNMYIKMSSKDSEIFRRYIANHCDAGGNYEMLLKTGF